MTDSNECRFTEMVGDISIEWCEVHKREEVDCLKEKLKVEEARRRSYQLMARSMAARAVLHVEDVSYDRAGGNTICSSCGLEYLDHPKGSMEFLTLLCDGTQVKL